MTQPPSPSAAARDALECYLAANYQPVKLSPTDHLLAWLWQEGFTVTTHQRLADLNADVTRNWGLLVAERKSRRDRDTILMAFHEECPVPTAAQIIDWTERYPQYADDIRGHAAVARDWAARGGLIADEPTKIELDRAFNRAIDILDETAERGKPAASDLVLAERVIDDLFSDPSWDEPFKREVRDAFMYALSERGERERERAAQVAECFDLGTPEGHAIAAAIRSQTLTGE